MIYVEYQEVSEKEKKKYFPAEKKMSLDVKILKLLIRPQRIVCI